MNVLVINEKGMKYLHKWNKWTQAGITFNLMYWIRFFVMTIIIEWYLVGLCCSNIFYFNLAETQLSRNPFLSIFFYYIKVSGWDKVVEIVLLETGIKIFEIDKREIKKSKVEHLKITSKQPHFVMCISLNQKLP